MIEEEDPINDGKMLLRVVIKILMGNSIPGNLAASRAREFLLKEVDPAEYQANAYERAQPQVIKIQENRLGDVFLREALTDWAIIISKFLHAL